jgi:hypothetical protein
MPPLPPPPPSIRAKSSLERASEVPPLRLSVRATAAAASAAARQTRLVSDPRGGLRRELKNGLILRQCLKSRPFRWLPQGGKRREHTAEQGDEEVTWRRGGTRHRGCRRMLARDGSVV